jgi:hypothetical protein
MKKQPTLISAGIAIVLIVGIGVFAMFMALGGEMHNDTTATNNSDNAVDKGNENAGADTDPSDTITFEGINQDVSTWKPYVDEELGVQVLLPEELKNITSYANNFENYLEWHDEHENIQQEISREINWTNRISGIESPSIKYTIVKLRNSTSQALPQYDELLKDLIINPNHKYLPTETIFSGYLTNESKVNYISQYLFDPLFDLCHYKKYGNFPRGIDPEEYTSNPDFQSTEDFDQYIENHIDCEAPRKKLLIVSYYLAKETKIYRIEMRISAIDYQKYIPLFIKIGESFKVLHE